MTTSVQHKTFLNKASFPPATLPQPTKQMEGKDHLPFIFAYALLTSHYAESFAK